MKKKAILEKNSQEEMITIRPKKFCKIVEDNYKILQDFFNKQTNAESFRRNFYNWKERDNTLKRDFEEIKAIMLSIDSDKIEKFIPEIEKFIVEEDVAKEITNLLKNKLDMLWLEGNLYLIGIGLRNSRQVMYIGEQNVSFQESLVKFETIQYQMGPNINDQPPGIKEHQGEIVKKKERLIFTAIDVPLLIIAKPIREKKEDGFAIGFTIGNNLMGRLKSQFIILSKKNLLKNNPTTEDWENFITVFQNFSTQCLEEKKFFPFFYITEKRTEDIIKIFDQSFNQQPPEMAVIDSSSL